MRHVEAYGQLAAAAGRDLQRVARRRAMFGTAALVLAIALATLGGGTLIAAAWSTPWRWWAAIGVLAAFAIGVGACVAAATAPMPDSTPMQALRDEWRKDKEWLSSRQRSAARDREVAPPVRESAEAVARRVPGQGRATVTTLRQA